MVMVMVTVTATGMETGTLGETILALYLTLECCSSWKTCSPPHPRRHHATMLSSSHHHAIIITSINGFKIITITMAMAMAMMAIFTLLAPAPVLQMLCFLLYHCDSGNGHHQPAVIMTNIHCQSIHSRGSLKIELDDSP